MKITNDVNNNIDFLSSSNKGDEDNSLLGSLFSINPINEEKNFKKISNDLEFTFKEDETKIIDYLSNILPNLNIGNLSSTDLKAIKNEIKSDINITSELKVKMLSLLESGMEQNKKFFIKIPEQQNVNRLTNKKLVNYPSNTETKIERFQFSSIPMKIANEITSKNEQKILKDNITNKNINGIINSEKELDKQQKLNSEDKNVNFVKKIKKIEHPNKLYQALRSKSSKHLEKMEATSILDKKSLDMNDINSANNQINEYLKKNKVDEIKANEKLSNLQNSFHSSSKGSQFAHQNNTSFSNSTYNSVLEGLLETLDLTKKGWTTKLVSRIENAFASGKEEIEFNLKPKNLGKLKVSISLKNGIGNVKIITENTFSAGALNQNENHLQKLFNDNGIDLEFSAHEDNQYFGSKNNFNKNSRNNNQENFLRSENELEKTNSKISLDNDVSSRHIVNVIA